MLDSLHRRPRGRTLARVLNRATGGTVASVPAFDVLRRELPVAAPHGFEASQALFDRLDEGDLATMESRLAPEDHRTWESARPEDRRYVALAFCVHYGVEGVSEKTGLSAAMPPAGVHTTASGSLAAGGSYYYADLVLEALRDAGRDPAELRRALDFGCSSGRVVRVLRTVLPAVEWHGCDPIADAIEWAQANLPGIEFRRSEQEPPLPYDDDAFDLVYAISIWSHFGEGVALRWLEEMRRVISPDGLLLLTVQGANSLAYFGREAHWSRDDLTRAAADLHAGGFHYVDVFGEHGDHGVRSPEWGMAFLTPEWLLANVTPEWSVLSFAIGRAEKNQDVVLLRRSESGASGPDGSRRR